MEKTVTFSEEALNRVNLVQMDTIIQMLQRESTAVISVMIDFSLPKDYVAFNDGNVYGGIDENGEVST